MNTKIKQIAFVAIGILGLLKIILLIVTGSFFGIVYYASWMAWFALVLFLVFMWFFYGFAFKAAYSWKFLTILLIVIAVTVVAIGFPTHATKFGSSAGTNNLNLQSAHNASLAEQAANSKNSSSKPSLIKCTAELKTPVEKAAGFTTEMFVSPLAPSRMPTQGIKTNTRTFSLADYADVKSNPIKDYRNIVEKTTLKEDVFFEATLQNPTAFSGKFTGKIQICDSNNMTSSNNDLAKDLYPVTSKDSIGFSDSLQVVNNLSNGLPTEPGDYRIDGFVYVDGKWTLTNRIDKITLTK